MIDSSEYIRTSYERGISIGSRQKKGLILREVKALFFMCLEKKNQIGMIGYELEGSLVVVLNKEPKFLILHRSNENLPLFITSVDRISEGDEVLWCKGDEYAAVGGSVPL